MFPTKRSRRVQAALDGAIHARRNAVECGINRLKNARRVATRYDKTAASHLAFVQLTAIRIWMTHFVNTA